MSESLQELLKKAWRGGRRGTLSALEEAKAWALREAWRANGKGDYGLHTFVAERVTKVGGGHPGRDAIRQFFLKVDSDVEWYPGKTTQEQHGPASVITPTKQAAVARSAMAMKDRGVEPTYANVVAANKEALRNPETGEPVNKKRVYAILEERCYDAPEHKEDTWAHRTLLQKKALPDPVIAARLAWALFMQARSHQAAWFWTHLVWTDICNSILPRSQRRAQLLALARKAKKGWGSKATKMQSTELVGERDSLKQKAWDAIRVWWAPVLARAKFHIELLGEDFPGETPAGAAILAAKVRAALNIRFQGSTPPDVLFTDRGQGFYKTRGGQVTPEFKAAVREHGLKLYYGDNAGVQPGRLQEVMLHETAVAWVRKRETVTQTTEPWRETVEEFHARLRGICQHVNANYDVDGLCRKFPERLQKVVDAEGDRIKP